MAMRRGGFAQSESLFHGHHEFSGRDMAHGKSFETWVNKFIEKKLAGETASIECDTLDDE